MKKTIKIGSKDVTLECNALTPFLFTEIFHKDFLTCISEFMRFQKKKPEEYTDEDLKFVAARTNVFAEIAFVLAKQAETDDVEKLTGLSKTDFYIWLSTIDEARAFSSGVVLREVIELWLGNTHTNVESKNA